MNNLCWPFPAIFALLLLGACASEDNVGQVGLALQTTGVNGKLYGLTATLDLVGPETQTFGLVYTDADFQEPVRAGAYSATLSNYQIREIDGATDPVVNEAVLVSPNPTGVGVPANGTGKLVYTFKVPEGDVTFATGTVDVDLVVTEGKTWGTPELIESNDVGGASQPRVAVDANGNAVAVWSQSDGARNNIWANRYVVGQGWGSAELIETDDVDSATYPQVGLDPSGNAVAAWQAGSAGDIWANRYVVGQGWGTPELVETSETGGAATDPQIAVDPYGNAIAVWSQSDGTRRRIWANRYVIGQGWGTAQLAEYVADPGQAIKPQVAIDPSGNAVVVWEHSDVSRVNIWANRYVVGQGWGTAELVETDDSADANDPQVAVDPSGNAVVVFSFFGKGVLANHYVVGQGWGLLPFRINDSPDGGWNPQVATDTNGNAVAVWVNRSGSAYDISANRYVAGQGWGTAELVDADDTGDASVPQVAVDPSGNAVTVWQQSDGTRENIWASNLVD